MKVDTEKGPWGEGLGFQRLFNASKYRYQSDSPYLVFPLGWIWSPPILVFLYYPPHIKTRISRRIPFISVEYYRSIQEFCYLEHQYFSVSQQCRRSSKSGEMRLNLLLWMVFKRNSYLDSPWRGTPARISSKSLYALNFTTSASRKSGSIESIYCKKLREEDHTFQNFLELN